MNKINNIKYIIAVLFIGIILQSCLEEEPKDFLTPGNFPQNEADLNAVLNGAYQGLVPAFGKAGIMSLCQGSEQFTSARGLNKAPNLEFNDFIVSTNNARLQAEWDALYVLVDRANQVIYYGEQLEIDEQTKKEIVGQGYYLRALAYFYLVRWWNEIPLILGQEAIDEIKTIGKSSAADIYTQIVDDVQKAESMLPEKWADHGGRPSKGAAKMLMADVYATMAGWPLNNGQEYYAKAAAKAKEVIDGQAKFGYALLNNYADIFSYEKRNNAENIFVVQGNVNVPLLANKAFRGSEEKGWKEWLAEADYFEQFPEDSRKPVVFKSVFKGGVNWKDSKEGHPWIFKYNDTGGLFATSSPNSANNRKLYRYAEAMLLYAECQNLADEGPNQMAIDNLNDIRIRAAGESAELVSSGISSEEFDQLVLQERNWEFGMESKRWFTIVRRNMVREANANHELGDAFDLSVITPEKYTFPIPEREVLLNPNLK